MKVFFTRRNVIVLGVAVVIAVFAIVSLNTSGDPGFISNGLNAVANPLRRVASSVARSFENIYGYMYEYELVVRENEELRRQLTDLRQEFRDASAVAEENDRLRELLNLSTRNPDFIFETADITQRGSSNWTSTFMINRGLSNSSVKPGDAVITETGVLIGRVTEVGPLTSVCVSVIDTTFAASVLVGELGASGSAHGDFTLMREGTLRLSYISGDTTVLIGDNVVTSGRGGVFPEGLVVGAVTAVRRDISGAGVYAVIEPAADLRSAAFVYIVTDFI